MSTAQRYVPYAYARDHGILLRPQGERDAEAWVTDATPLAALNEVMRVFPGKVTPVLVEQAALREAIAQTYSAAEGSAQQIVGDIEGELDLGRMLAEVPDIEDLLETEDDAPIIRMINALLTQAARDGASDIHIEAFETYSMVRFRVDGTLRDIVRPKRALHSALVSRIKIMASLDIAEKRLPQDGRITLRVGGRAVDVRVSTLPTGHGERVVLRLLDKQAGVLDFTRLGMSDPTRDRMDELIREAHGIVLVTGPTGSGKTTTLYAGLSRLDADELNIMTVEDPIEYDLDGIGQTQVNAAIDMTFARALRSILRQDPDVVMIGEIRDLETARIAVQASLTGHLVLATLHTNDAVGAITRLIDMGVEPFLLSSSMLGVLAQRLVRKLCPDCRIPGAPSPAEQTAFPAVTGMTVYRPVGCPSCKWSGYRGRTGIYELVVIDRRAAALIHSGASEQLLRAHASRSGAMSLREDGLRWIEAGETSVEEVLRVSRAGAEFGSKG